MLEQITNINSKGFHLPGEDIDTERIIPARFLKCVTFDGLGDHAFEDDRQQQTDHPFNDEKNAGCSILVVDENFASGSSREHAVPALTQRGIQAIIGLSFSDIFSGNAVGNGLVCVTVNESFHEFIANKMADGFNDIDIDLDVMEIMIDGTAEPCTMPEADRDNLMNGTWDAMETCLQAGKLIEEAAARLPYFKLPVQ